jgi:4'-phosphopantetheinyl transferase EntD
MAPADVDVGARRIDAADLKTLWPAEAAAVRAAVAKRRQEFASGRALLRQLLRLDAVILVGRDRAPVLPTGIVASLAHDATYVVAAVSAHPDVRALGIDIEPAVPLADDIAALVLRHDEDDLDAHLAFTLKEAAYKAWSASGGRLLDHQEVRLTVDVEEFSAEVIDDQTTFAGTYRQVADRWVALVVARAERQRQAWNNVVNASSTTPSNAPGGHGD